MSDRIEKHVELAAPVERVWRALSDPVEFGTWFRVKLDGPFVPGQESRGRITYPGYEHVEWQATVVAVTPPRLLSYTWHPYAVDAARDYSDEEPTQVEFHLEPRDGGTHLTITESGFDNLPSARRAEALRMNEGGWIAQIHNLRAHLGDVED
ncbi:MAG: SRPBCC family protein [Azospirillaceae bacterium]|nr:SRPBCC family protein [Azospirillaceae bacterium]